MITTGLKWVFYQRTFKCFTHFWRSTRRTKKGLLGTWCFYQGSRVLLDKTSRHWVAGNIVRQGLILLSPAVPVDSHRPVLVQIYFTTATFDQIDRDVLLTVEAQLGLIGGTMGLLTGFSILSGVEIVYFTIKFILSLRIRSHLHLNKRNMAWTMTCEKKFLLNPVDLFLIWYYIL